MGVLIVAQVHGLVEDQLLHVQTKNAQQVNLQSLNKGRSRIFKGAHHAPQANTQKEQQPHLASLSIAQRASILLNPRLQGVPNHLQTGVLIVHF